MASENLPEYEELPPSYVNQNYIPESLALLLTPQDDEIVKDQLIAMWKFRILEKGGIIRIVSHRDPYSDEFISKSNDYEIKFSNGHIEKVELNVEGRFVQILTPKQKVRYDCFLVLDTDWIQIKKGNSLCQVETLTQISWIVYGMDLKPIVERTYKGTSNDIFSKPMMQLACDLAEFTPIILGHNIIDCKDHLGFDIPNLKRIFPNHPALARTKYIFDTMHYNTKSLNTLIKKWVGREQTNDTLQNCKDTFEMFWRKLTNKPIEFVGNLPSTIEQLRQNRHRLSATRTGPKNEYYTIDELKKICDLLGVSHPSKSTKNTLTKILLDLL